MGNETSCQSVETNTNVSSSEPYVNPLFELVKKGKSQQEIIDNLNAYCGTHEIEGENEPMFEQVDQYEFIAPALQLFTHCACYGMKDVVQWFIDNYVPLQVSYDNNFCYFECLRYGHYDIIEMITRHESFEPSFSVMENMLQRSKHHLFMASFNNSNIPSEINDYHYTFRYLMDRSEYQRMRSLFNSLKERHLGNSVKIIYAVMTEEMYKEHQNSIGTNAIHTTEIPFTSDQEENEECDECEVNDVDDEMIDEQVTDEMIDEQVADHYTPCVSDEACSCKYNPHLVQMGKVIEQIETLATDVSDVMDSSDAHDAHDAHDANEADEMDSTDIPETTETEEMDSTDATDTMETTDVTDVTNVIDPHDQMTNVLHQIEALNTIE